VTLTATSPSGQVTEIGTATTNIAGSYGIPWTPNEEGQYLIKAVFSGTNAYGSSYDMTYLGVGPAQAQPTQPSQSPTQAPTDGPSQSPSQTTTTSSPTPAVEPNADNPTETLLIAAAAAVIVIAVIAAALVLRKRK